MFQSVTSRYIGECSKVGVRRTNWVKISGPFFRQVKRKNSSSNSGERDRGGNNPRRWVCRDIKEVPVHGLLHPVGDTEFRVTSIRLIGQYLYKWRDWVTKGSFDVISVNGPQGEKGRRNTDWGHGTLTEVTGIHFTTQQGSFRTHCFNILKSKREN